MEGSASREPNAAISLINMSFADGAQIVDLDGRLSIHVLFVEASVLSYEVQPEVVPFPRGLGDLLDPILPSRVEGIEILEAGQWGIFKVLHINTISTAEICHSYGSMIIFN